MDRVRRVLIDAFLFLTILPAFAQIDLSGVWINNLHEDMQDRIFGPELGDYTGIPLNAAARARAEAWDASLLTLPEYQCRVHPSDYAPSFADIRIWEEIDKDTQSLAAVHLHHFAFATERTIWMDGRPHPPDYALHTSMGFSTGKWDGDILTVTTTHLAQACGPGPRFATRWSNRAFGRLLRLSPPNNLFEPTLRRILVIGHWYRLRVKSCRRT